MRDVSGEESWRPFTARQSITTSRCSFEWRARTGIGGWLTVTDALIGNEGQLRVSAFSLVPLMRSTPSAQLTRGELLRYLAELPFAPDAMLFNSGLVWRSMSEGRISVGAELGRISAEVFFELDSAGRIATVYAPDRPRAVGRTFVGTPWQGSFSDYRMHEGRQLPFFAEVAWILDGMRVVCWRGCIELVRQLNR